MPNLGLQLYGLSNLNPIKLDMGKAYHLDTLNVICNTSDITKQVIFDVSGITTVTTRTITFPNVSGTIATINNAATWSATQTFNAVQNFPAGANWSFTANSTNNVYRTTNGGANIATFIFAATSMATAGVFGISIDPTNQIVLTHANGTRQIAGASLQLVNLDNTAGSEDSDLAIQTQAAGAAMATRITISSANMTLTDPYDIILGTTTGTKIGTSVSQKLGFWNVAPVIQYLTTGTTTGFTANTSVNTVFNESTWTGNTGATAYTISDVVRALKLCGIMLA